MLTDSDLAQITRNASARRRALVLQPLNDAMREHQIDTLLRAAAFVAQLAHESGEFQFLEELWGPTPAQKRYEPPSDLARRLGNTDAGDGFRYKGRGPIQITGRANYKTYGGLLGIDLVEHPERAAEPEIGFRTAGLFWTRNGLNELADAGDFKAVTQRINGGQNGAADRERFYEIAKFVLVDSFPAPAGAPARAGASPAKREPFERGAEALHADDGGGADTAAHRGEEAAASAAATPSRRLDVRADTLDFRDLMYTPTLIEVPTHIPLGEYLEYGVPILDQGQEGACTGFGLATVANYLLLRRRVIPDKVPVSARMFYEMARRYDEWPGEDYSGSSARGAMKGWHKHGACSDKTWPYQLGSKERKGLTDARAVDAQRRPLGSYFRVNHTDLIAMHAAIAEVGVLYATSTVHAGWQNVGEDGIIHPSEQAIGGHAFAIVAYDTEGFWIQNSWGDRWGKRGFARISYDDWLDNATDVWVARLGAPVVLRRAESSATANAASAGASASYAYADLRSHIVSVGNDGRLKAGGDYGSTPDELGHIFEDDMPRAMKDWGDAGKKPRVLLYAHGGLVSEAAAVQRLAEYRPALLADGVYPLAFIWRTDYWTTIKNTLQDALRRRRPEGFLDSAKDFMLDRLDDALEPVARLLTGKTVWDEMKQNALDASTDAGAATRVADHLQALAKKMPGLEIHLVGHSAGSIFLAPMVKLLTDRGLEISTCTLWAPACTVDLFKSSYVPAFKERTLKKLAVFALSDATERDDNCAHVYNKSLLYLVSDAFEKQQRIPGVRDGVPIVGMERWIDAELRSLLQGPDGDLVLAPNHHPLDTLRSSNAMHHGDFDDDEPTVRSTFGRILGGTPAAAPARREMPAMDGVMAGVPAGAAAIVGESAAHGKAAAKPAAKRMVAAPMFSRSSASLRERRQRLDERSRPE